MRKKRLAQKSFFLEKKRLARKSFFSKTKLFWARLFFAQNDFADKKNEIPYMNNNFYEFFQQKQKSFEQRVYDSSSVLYFHKLLYSKLTVIKTPSLLLFENGEILQPEVIKFHKPV